MKESEEIQFDSKATYYRFPSIGKKDYLIYFISITIVESVIYLIFYDIKDFSRFNANEFLLSFCFKVMIFALIYVSMLLIFLILAPTEIIIFKNGLQLKYRNKAKNILFNNLWKVEYFFSETKMLLARNPYTIRFVEKSGKWHSVDAIISKKEVIKMFEDLKQRNNKVKIENNV